MAMQASKSQVRFALWLILPSLLLLLVGRLLMLPGGPLRPRDIEVAPTEYLKTKIETQRKIVKDSYLVVCLVESKTTDGLIKEWMHGEIAAVHAGKTSGPIFTAPFNEFFAPEVA